MLPDSLRYPPDGKPWLLFGLMGMSLVLNVALAVRLGGSDAPAATDAPLGESGVAAFVSDAVPGAPVQVVGDDTTVSNAAVPPEDVAPLPEPTGVVQVGGRHVFSAAVHSSLSATFQSAPTENAAALSAVYSRLFVWDLDLRRDLHRGDIVHVLYEEPASSEPLVLAARLVSQPGTGAEKTYAAFRYKSPGDRFDSYWAADGSEVPMRLIDGPLADFEQITSRLKDRPSHEGMDFKTPIGTPIVAPRAGVVTRANWNHAANGNCLELRYSDGVIAKFLHLNENEVKEGERVSGGTEIAKSGNTGHSTGPHLHYQLERGGRVLDPVDYHGTLRRTLPPEAMPEFTAKMGELAAQLDAQLASN